MVSIVDRFSANIARGRARKKTEQEYGGYSSAVPTTAINSALSANPLSALTMRQYGQLQQPKAEALPSDTVKLAVRPKPQVQASVTQTAEQSPAASPMATGIDGVSKLITNGKTLYSDASNGKQPIANEGMTSVVPAKQATPIRPELAKVQQEMPIAQRPYANVQSNVDPAMLQEAIARNQAVVNKVVGSQFRGVDDLAAAQVAQKNLDSLLGSDAASQNIQMKSNDMTQADNQFLAKLGEEKRQSNQNAYTSMLEQQQKQPYLDSEIALNNAQVQAALTPKPVGEKWQTMEDADGQLVQVSSSGIKRPVIESPEMKQQKQMAAYQADYKRLFDPEDPNFSGLSDAERQRYLEKMKQQYGIK